MDGNQVDKVVPRSRMDSGSFPSSIARVGEPAGIRSIWRNARFLVFASMSDEDQHQARPAAVHRITIIEVKSSFAHRIAVADKEAPKRLARRRTSSAVILGAASVFIRFFGNNRFAANK